MTHDFLPGRSFDECRERFAPYFRLDRDHGILTARSHWRDGPAVWSRGLLNAWNLLLADISADRETELVILTGTGDAWLDGVDTSSFASPMRDWADQQFIDGVRLLERMVLDIDVPTVGVVNGPGPRLEIPLLCDLTLAAPDVLVGDGNFAAGSVPGDGMYLVLRELVGTKRAAALVYTGERIAADRACELGLVNEVVPRAGLLPRARELAEQIMARPPAARQMTHRLIARDWQRRVVGELRGAYAQQLLVTATA